MTKLLNILFVCLSISLWCHAQQDAQYTQYMFNSQVVNPAYVGSPGGISFSGIYRNQWVSVDGAPETFSIAANGLAAGNHGWGVFVENDKIGIHKRLSAFGAYAFHLGFSESTRLSIGLQGGILQYQSNWLDQPPKDVTDLVFQENESRLVPNFGVGIYFYSTHFYAGISSPHLLDSSLDDSVEALSRQYRHYFFTAGGVLPVSPILKIKPSLLVKSVPASAPINVDVNLSLFIKDALMVGAGYRTSNNLMFLLHYQFINGLRLGYAYDYSLNNLADFHSGSHEVMIGWDISTGGKLEKVLHPRYF